MNALGMIECQNIPKGIEAADSMLKAADVSLLTAQAVCAGKYIVLISGDVAAVSAAVEAGADAVELNVYAVSADPRRSAADVEAAYLDIIREVKAAISVPLTVKLSPFFSSFSHFAAAAVDFVRETPPDGAIVLTITGDEEGPGKDGTVALLDWMRAQGEGMSVCLVGEPTCPERMGEMIKIGRRGSVSGTVTVFGTQGHVAYPHLADNPVRGVKRYADKKGETFLSATELAKVGVFVTCCLGPARFRGVSGGQEFPRPQKCLDERPVPKPN